MKKEGGFAFRLSPLALSLVVVFLVIAVSAALFVVSRAGESSSDAWYRALARADELIASGETRKAAQALLSLRKGAAGSGQWLSIVKRERTLGLTRQSIDTLRKALVKSPASDSLAAVLADSLAEAGLLDEAARIARPLLSSRFSALAAHVCLAYAAKSNDVTLLETQCLDVAYESTGIPLFLRNAIALSAERGEMGVACEYARKLIAEASDSDVIDNVVSDDIVISSESVSEGFSAVASPSMSPNAFPSERDYYLASLVRYDAGLFHDALRVLMREGYVPSAADLELRADAAWRIGDRPKATADWGESTRLFPERSPVAWFNLSVVLDDGTTDGQNESIRAIESCLNRFPKYYPAVARFARMAVIRDAEGRANDPVHSQRDPVSEYLISRDFLSEDAREALLPPRYSIERAQGLLDSACSGDAHALDARFLIERARLLSALDPDRSRSTAEMWKLLERFPDDPFVGEYAVWYFSSQNEFSTAFSINRGLANGGLEFYYGLEEAMGGNHEKALERFESGARDGKDAWVSLANIAAVRERSGDIPRAIEDLSTAAALALDLSVQSRLHLRLARLLIRSRSYERAESVLGYALELDATNHRARALLMELEQEK